MGAGTTRYRCGKCPSCRKPNQQQEFKFEDTDAAEREQIFNEISKIGQDNRQVNCNDVVKLWTDTNSPIRDLFRDKVHGVKLFALQLICDGYIEICKHETKKICYFHFLFKWQRDTFKADSNIKKHFQLDTAGDDGLFPRKLSEAV